jgi:hypothetical protein
MLDASVRDIAERRIPDANAVQAEARRMLADHERARPEKSLPRREPMSRRSRPAT